ncbi:MAG: MerR family transcriptional regulator [Pirellulaceae bacterium]|nr:MerR family transcriptional regulator [Pirellulaceae bacterium]
MVPDASSPNPAASDLLRGKRLALLGRFASMAKRDVAALIRRHGAIVSERPSPAVDWIVVGEHGLPLLDEASVEDELDPEIHHAIESGRIELIGETQLWQRLGMVEGDREVQRLYTPAMLAELLGVELAIIRRWHRRGLIRPAREVRHLPYFDFREVAAARRLAELLAAGVSPRAIERKLAALRGTLPGVERPLAQLSVIIEGRQILLRQGDGLIEPGGQLRFDFDAVESDAPMARDHFDEVLPLHETTEASDETKAFRSPRDLAALAAELEETGQLAEAAETYRAAMAAGGPTPERCFQLAELLYRMGDPAAARERYYMAVELDEDYVEARANLGCLLAEMGQLDLAVAALSGALAYHADYPDAHYHLAKTLQRLERADEARKHWRAFLDLAPDSPWADEARTRLGEDASH